jgi:hypothetical protein
MSITDGPNVTDFDRRQESLDREREAARSSLETTSGGRPIGSPAQINEASRLRLLRLQQTGTLS